MACSIKAKVYVEPTLKGGTKMNGPGHNTKLATISIYSKKKTIILPVLILPVLIQKFDALDSRLAALESQFLLRLQK